MVQISALLERLAPAVADLQTVSYTRFQVLIKLMLDSQKILGNMKERK